MWKCSWFLDWPDHPHQICRWLHLPQFLDLLKLLKQGARVERLWKCSSWMIPGSPTVDAGLLMTLPKSLSTLLKLAEWETYARQFSPTHTFGLNLAFHVL